MPIGRAPRGHPAILTVRAICFTQSRKDEEKAAKGFQFTASRQTGYSAFTASGRQVNLVEDLARLCHDGMKMDDLW